LLCAVYLATFLSFSYLAGAAALPFGRWIQLLSIVVATIAVIAIVERGRWRLGLAVAPTIALMDLLTGFLFAAILVVFADRLIAGTSNLRHGCCGGFPWLELLLVFLPAAIHEELVFRGYAYQKLRTWSRGGAIAVTSLIFAALHSGNASVTRVAMLNLFLAGILLALAYERWQRLWFPIGIHVAWNVISGPILGYDVSGYVAGTTLLTTRGAGPLWITGGTFGIEGSIWTAAVELLGIVALAKKDMIGSVLDRGQETP
jgi:membrane protease YdiL (CAAX protease family)